MKRVKDWRFWAGMAVAWALAAIIADCCFGHTNFYECAVVDRYHVDEWWETQTHTDSKGNTSTIMIYHPEEWHVVCEESAGRHSFDCQPGESAYNALSDGQAVTIRAREGRWTHHGYLAQIYNHE